MEEDELLKLQDKFNESKGISGRQKPVPKEEGKDVIFGSVLSDVQERTDTRPLVQPIFHATGFPKALHRSLKPFGKARKKDQKIFQNASIGPEIHEENVKLLNGMTNEEIEEARADLLANLSKDSISYLESRGGAQAMKATAIDLPILKETKKKLIPTKQESGKLDWTNYVDPEANTSLRFNLKGDIIMADSIPDSGPNPDFTLYHHGNNPDQAGYTIFELVHLTKSTFPQQRSSAFRSLAFIKGKVWKNHYIFEDEKAIERSLKGSHALFSGRSGLDASQDSVIAAALGFIGESVGAFGDQQSLLDDLACTSNGTRAMSYEEKSLVNFGFLKAKEAEDLDDSIESVMSCLDKDPILGLLLTNLVVRLHALLQSDDSTTQLQIILILMSIARHSPSSAEDILACSGLVDRLRYLMFSQPWPPVDTSKVEIVEKIIQLFRCISLSSREACNALMKYEVTQDLVKFISLIPAVTSNFFNHMSLIFRQVILYLDVSFSYGLGGSIIDKFRMLFYHFCAQYTLLASSEPSELLTNTLSSFCKMLQNSLISFQTPLDAGGPNDAMLPFISVLSDLLQHTVNDQTQLKFNLSALALLHTYVHQSYQHQASQKIAERLRSIITSTIPLTLSLDIKKDIAAGSESEYGIGLVSEARLSDASKLLQATLQCDYLAQIASSATLLHKRGMLDASTILQSIIPAVNSILKTQINRNDFIRFYAQGINTLLNAVIDLSETMRKKKEAMDLSEMMRKKREVVDLSEKKKEVIDLSDEKKIDDLEQVILIESGLDDCKKKKEHYFDVFEATIYLLNSLLPGDDCLTPKLLSILTFSTHFHYLHSAESYHSSLSVRRDHAAPPTSFVLLTTQLPLKHDWIYSTPLNYFARGAACDPDSIAEWLQLTKTYELRNAGNYDHLDTSIKIFNLMHVFLLSDSSGNEIFRSENVRSNLLQILNVLRPSTVIRIPHFFTLYQTLLDQFIAVSYGDSVFASYLLLPCSMDYAFDFRLSFFTKLRDYVHVISIKECDLGQGSITPYITPLESNKDVLQIMKSILAAGRVTKEGNPVIFEIIKSHLKLSI